MLLDVQYHIKELDATIKSCIEDGLQFNPYFDEGLVSKDNVKESNRTRWSNFENFRKLDKQISVAEDKLDSYCFVNCGNLKQIKSELRQLNQKNSGTKEMIQ